MTRFVSDEAAMRALGRELARSWKAGDLVLLVGPLGAGKTTLVRGVLEGIGYQGTVRSPTFSLLQVYATDPPVLHADLYRLPVPPVHPSPLEGRGQRGGGAQIPNPPSTQEAACPPYAGEEIEAELDIGLDEYLDTHLCLIEWPDRLPGWILALPHVLVAIAPEGDGRRVTVEPRG